MATTTFTPTEISLLRHLVARQKQETLVALGDSDINKSIVGMSFDALLQKLAEGELEEESKPAPPADPPEEDKEDILSLEASLRGDEAVLAQHGNSAAEGANRHRNSTALRAHSAPRYTPSSAETEKFIYRLRIVDEMKTVEIAERIKEATAEQIHSFFIRTAKKTHLLRYMYEETRDFDKAYAKVQAIMEEFLRTRENKSASDVRPEPLSGARQTGYVRVVGEPRGQAVQSQRYASL